MHVNLVRKATLDLSYIFAIVTFRTTGRTGPFVPGLNTLASGTLTLIVINVSFATILRLASVIWKNLCHINLSLKVL